ncbi:MAG: TVP38/TMEM64 family protein [Candidatus Omnitrophica bacterium]|nr:TVP38/TMEM64 family protein [Candidatus Omnitrophota bacterium]MDD5237179.1 TVP38/TMEM64 family protein [Candidatus Omnitrophota bacterium]
MDKINNHNEHFSKKLIEFLIGVLVSIAILLIIKYLCRGIKDLSPASLRDYIRGHGNFGVMVYMLFYVLDTLVLVPPMSGVAMTAGLAFGPLWGFIYLMISAMVGTHIAFFLARKIARKWIEKAIERRFKNLDDFTEKNGFQVILFFRIIPLIPYEILNYASGLSRVRLKDFTLATLIGLIPGALISVYFGYSLSDVRRFRDIFSFKVILATIIVVLIICGPLIYKFIKKIGKQINDKD